MRVSPQASIASNSPRTSRRSSSSQRDVPIALADITFEDALDLDLGGVDVHIEHVGGDHAPDSSVVYVEQDRVLFLGDSLYASTSGPERTLTTKLAFPLLDTVLSFDAELFVEGHTESVMSRTEIATLVDDFRRAGTLVDECVSSSGAVGRDRCSPGPNSISANRRATSCAT